MIYIATDNYNDGFPLSNAYDDTIYQKANAEYYLKFRFPVDRLGIWKHLTCETILKADDTRGLQLFKIKKINKINGYVRVYAKHITDDLNFIGVDKIAVSNATGRRVMEALAGSTTEQHSFIFNSDVATMHTLNLTNTTAGKVLIKDKHSILGQWGGELIRDNFLVDLKARAGVDTEILFMNKKNVKNLDNAISTENITTRLKLSVELEGEGNNKQTITATVDSPNINAYPRVYTNYLKVNSKTITNQAQLIEYGKKYFRDTLVDFPSDNLTVNVIDRNQERVNLFDTVWFRNVEFDIDKRLKVVAYEFSPMSKRYKKISFGALKVANFGQIKSLSQLEEKIDEKITESFTDAFKIQKNLSELLKLDRKAIEDKMLELEEKSKGAVEVKRALFEADGTIPDVVKTKILDAVEGDIGRLKTIITEAELIKAIQAKLNFAEIKNALIDKAFINQIISDERFTQQFEDGQVTTQNIFTKLKDSIKSNILKEVITKDGVKKIVNDLTVDADGIRQITQEEITNRREELKGKSSYIHTRYSDNANGSNFDTNSNRKYIGIYSGEKEQAPTNPSEYSWTKIRGEDGARGRDGNNGRDGVDGKSYARNYITDSDKLANINSGGTNWEKTVENGTLVFTKVRTTESTGIWAQIMPILKDNFQNEVLTWSIDVKASKNISFNNVGQETNGFKGRVDITTDWQRISHTFTNRYTQHYAFVFYQMIGTCSPGDKVYVRLPKLEKGNVATEWSPAYEDLRGRDGVSNYIHRKYSDSSNGANMSDNSNLKYIGIYTGTSPTPPTTASSYLWSKIKGEDGANGTPGVKGADGRTPYFHTAYSNSPTGDRDFSTTNSNDKLYIGTYSDFVVADSTDYRRYKWVKIKGENGRNGTDGRDGVSSYIYRKYSDNANGSPMSDNSNLKYIGIYTGTSATAPTTPTSYTWSKIKGEDGAQGVPGARGSDGRTSYLHTAYSNSATGDRDFSTTNSNGKEYIGTYTDFEINDSNDYRRYKWVKIKGENGRNGTDGHTLTANLRLEGTYINGVTNNVKGYLDVFYDGQKITDGFNAQIKFKGGILNAWSNFWTAKVDNTGFLTNVSWGNKEQTYPIALELIALVTYKGLNTVANARLDNVPNIEEVKETIQRYRRFESTLSEFRSEIGYVKETTQILGDTVPDLSKDKRTTTGNDVYFYPSVPLKANTPYTIVANISGLTAKQEAGIYNASGNNKKYILNGTNFWVVQFPSQQDRVNFYPLGTKTTISNVRIYEGDFTETLQGNLYVTHTIHPTVNKWLVITLNKKLEGKDLVLYFDVDGDVSNKSFWYNNALSNFSGNADVEFPLKNKDNVVSVSSFGNSIITLVFNYANPTIKNVRVYEVNYAFRKLTQTQTQNIGTVFKQSAEDIIVAWNNYNKYFSFNNETLDILEKDSYQNKYKKISLTSEGLKIYNNNTLIGTIGTFTHLGQSFRQNTFDIVLTDDTKAFGVYTWQDFSAFGSRTTGYAPLFEIKKDEGGTYRSYFHQPLQVRTAYIDRLSVAETGTSYVGGVTKTINVGGRYLKFVQGILVSG